jgi:hypothetical protein
MLAGYQIYLVSLQNVITSFLKRLLDGWLVRVTALSPAHDFPFSPCTPGTQTARTGSTSRRLSACAPAMGEPALVQDVAYVDAETYLAMDDAIGTTGIAAVEVAEEGAEGHANTPPA